MKDATKDENAVIFTRWQQEAFDAVRAAVEAYISDDKTAAVGGAAGAGVSSVAGELAKLAQLRDSGVLTEAEFAAQKARLLS